MKKIGLFVSVAMMTSIAFAQPGTKPVAAKPTTTKPVAKPIVPVLKNIEDSASYAVGVSVANFYKQQGIKSLNTALVSRAINDVMAGKTVLLDDAAANACMNNYMTKMQSEKSKPRMDSGTNFLAKNKLKAGIITTASGLQYEVITAGTGIMPTANDSVTCHYKGTLLSGFVFDNSFDRGEPITFNLGGVIKGWTEGLQLMNVGAKYKFYIPYTLGYGAFDYGPIPGGSMLTFEVDLLDVKKVEQSDQ